MALRDLSPSRFPQRYQFLIFTVLVLVLCYVFYLSYVQPLKDETDRLQARVDYLSIEIQKGQIVQTRLPELGLQVQQQEEKLARLREILPEQKETAEIIRRLQELAAESQLRIRSFTPQRTVRREFYEDWPILIALEGNYDNLGIFFERIGRFTRIINVDNINIKARDSVQNGVTLSAICTATTFVFLESDDQPSGLSRGSGTGPATTDRRTGS